MSTTDPDARNRSIAAALRPIAYTILVIALISGPVFGWLFTTVLDPDTAGVPVYLIWLFLTVGGGLFVYYTVRHIAALSIAAYCVAGVGGMFLVMGLGAGASDGDPKILRNTLIIAGVAYVVAAVLYGLHLRTKILQDGTRDHGVNVDAEVTSAGVSGMVNYVQLWKLTLKFTDQQGTTRWFRTHLLGVGGWNVGDTVPIRYDARHPGTTAAIVVDP